MRPIPELIDLFERLPITEANFGVYEALLRLPYDIYRPVLDLMFEGRLFPEDLLPAPSSGLAAADGAAAQAALARSANDVDAAAMRRRIDALLAGQRPAVAVAPRDSTVFSVGPDGRLGALYAPPTSTVVGTDASVSCPGPIETARAGSRAAAKKAAQEAFLAATQPDLG